VKINRPARRRAAPVIVEESVMTASATGYGKSKWDKFGPIMMVVMIGMAFALGALWNKAKTLEGGSAAAGAAVNSKYKSFKAAVDAYGKEVGLDVKKLDSCVQSGSKESLVSADEQEGAALGVQGTPGFFVNGRFVGGAFPFENFKELIELELAGKGSDDVKVYSQAMQAAASQSAFNPVAQVVNVGAAATKGPTDAKVVIVEYSDAQCPYCERAYQTFKQVFKEYGDKILFVYKHYPLRQIHPNAQKASEVLLCAQDQGKFWAMHDKLFDNLKEWSPLAGGWD